MRQNSVLVIPSFFLPLLLDQVLPTPITFLRIFFSHLEVFFLEVSFYLGGRVDFNYFIILTAPCKFSVYKKHSIFFFT